jgi:hypothetical protein
MPQQGWGSPDASKEGAEVASEMALPAHSAEDTWLPSLPVLVCVHHHKLVGHCCGQAMRERPTAQNPLSSP